MAEILAFTDANFEEEVLKDEGLVAVEFVASWCTHCRKLNPTIRTLAETYAGRLKLGKVDVFTETAVTKECRILSTPSVLFFRGGAEIARLVGSNVRDHLKERLAELVGA